jgi:serine/threonine protein kinase
VAVQVENIMLDRNGHARLVDFGLATQFNEASQPSGVGASSSVGFGGEPLSPTGSLLYMPPELLRDKVHIVKATLCSEINFLFFCTFRFF